jgi:hypothetical protein
MDLNTEIYARFLGLYFMKMEIPQDVVDWVLSHSPPNDGADTSMIVRMIAGAPDTKDEILKEMIKSIL